MCRICMQKKYVKPDAASDIRHGETSTSYGVFLHSEFRQISEVVGRSAGIRTEGEGEFTNSLCTSGDGCGIILRCMGIDFVS